MSRVKQIQEKLGNYAVETTKGFTEFIKDFEYLLEQAEKLEELKKAYFSDDFTPVEYIKASAKVFEE